MDKVTILSRQKFMEFMPPVAKDQVVAIRIADVRPAKDKRYLATLSLAFFDEWTYADEIDRNTPAGSNRLTAEDKVTIDHFIDQFADKYFVLHCEQGISRSAAVGYYILKRLGYTKELNEKKESALYSPNIEAYGVLVGKPYTRQTAGALRREIEEPEEI